MWHSSRGEKGLGRNQGWPVWFGCHAKSLFPGQILNAALSSLAVAATRAVTWKERLRACPE